MRLRALGHSWCILFGAVWCALAGTPAALEASTRVPKSHGTQLRQDPPPVQRFVLVIRDARTGEPLPGVEVQATSGGPWRSDSTGTVTGSVTGAVIGAAGGAPPSPAGAGAAARVTLSLRRLGYAPWRGSVIADGRTERLALIPVAATLAKVDVRSRAFGSGGIMQASSVVTAQQLAERMAASVAATIDAEPGVTSRSNGPMATQPVIRGLGGDRVLVLEDGLRTGDIATTAPDHAVTIEPATARRIEVIRGPAGLIYGSNTLGGVVNVVRDDVPRVRPEQTQWQASTFGESVNRGLGAAARVTTATGPVVWQADGSTRTAGNTRTPRGITLPFTDVDGFDGGAGVAFVKPRGHAGVAVRDYRTFYGVPSSFNGVTLPGAHDGGVYVDVRRSVLRGDAEWRSTGGLVEAIAVSANAVRFEQAEFEQGGFVGTEFGQLAASGDAVMRLQRGRHRGAVGVFSQWRDLRAAGSFTGTRPAVQRTVAAFAVDEVDFGRVTLLAGLRVDQSRTQPLDSTETLLLRDIRTRAFRATTGALGVRTTLGAGWSASVQVARAFRPPSIEELYSAGPHLASYAYEVGVPTLDAERGLGVDGTVRWQGARGRVELAAYAMRIDDFITFAPQIDSLTGAPLRDPRLRRYVVYRPVQQDAELHGFEAQVVIVPRAGWTLDVAADLPRGSQVRGAPLPAMPAASLRADLRRSIGGWTAGVIVDTRFSQTRVPIAPSDGQLSCSVQVRDGEASVLPAEFCPTPGVVLVGAVLSVPVPRAWRTGWQTALTLTADNLFDTAWRDPLWRAKQVAPQPGRNVRIAIQVTP